MPAFPEGLEHIWMWFLELSKTRHFGEVDLAISHQEITAWAAGENLVLTTWERRLLRRMDDAVLAVWRGTKSTTPTATEQVVAANNPKAVRQLVRGVLSQKRASAQQQATKEA